MDIVTLLDQLADLQDAAQVTRLDYEAKRSEILKAIKPELDELDAEYQPLMNLVQEQIDSLTADAKSAVTSNGASVKGSRLHAVYAKGRVTWDSKKLDGMMILLPQLAEARKEGEPSVAIRTVKMTAFPAPDIGLFIAVDRNGQPHYRQTPQEAQDEAAQVAEQIVEYVDDERKRKMDLAMEMAGANLQI